jgi:hypothetical protein
MTTYLRTSRPNRSATRGWNGFGILLNMAMVTLGAPIICQAQVALGATLVTHAISDKYAALGGPAGPLGQQLGSEQVALDGLGHFQDFKNGSIYWSPITGAHSVFGAIRTEFTTKDGGPDGFLGYPISDDPLPMFFHGDVLLCPVDANGNPEGRVVRFESGIIYSDDLCADRPIIVTYDIRQALDQVFHADHQTQHAHVKPYKGFVSLFGTVERNSPNINGNNDPRDEDGNPLPVDNPTYADFLRIGDQDYDGDINFDFQVDWAATLGADPAFWEVNPQFGPSWYNSPSCCGNFVVNYLNGNGSEIHAEAIMYGLYDLGAASQCLFCDYQFLAGHPAFFQGWAERGDESVQLNSFAPGGFRGGVNGDGHLLHEQVSAGSYVRITGTLITDCHGVFGDCEGDAHVEVHQVNSIDLLPGGIAAKYQALGGGAGFLGSPADPPISTPVGPVAAQHLAQDGVGLLEDFQSGSIVWSPRTGAHDLFGPILAKWIQIGGVTSPLGYPITDERTAADGSLVSDFEGGTISYSPGTGVVVSDRSLAVTPPADQTAVEEEAESFGIGVFAASVGGPWSVDVNWGDDTPHANFTASAPGPLPAQSHTFAEEASYNVTVTVTDLADGAAASTTFRVNVIVTAASIVSDVHHLIDAGQINQRLGTSLLSKLDNAAAARTRGNCAASDNMYQAFVNELMAQTGKKVDASVARMVASDAQFLIDHCGVEGGLVLAETGTPDEEQRGLSSAYRLYQAAPNPFNPNTTIRYDLPQSASVELRVYDVSGRLVRVLVRSESQPAGHYVVSWDGKDDRGYSVSAGIYFYRIGAGSFEETRRMLLVK